MHAPRITVFGLSYARTLYYRTWTVLRAHMCHEHADHVCICCSREKPYVIQNNPFLSLQKHIVFASVDLWFYETCTSQWHPMTGSIRSSRVCLSFDRCQSPSQKQPYLDGHSHCGNRRRWTLDDETGAVICLLCR